MSTIIIITVPPKPPTKPGKVQEIPAVGEGSIADLLRDAADFLDGKED